MALQPSLAFDSSGRMVLHDTRACECTQAGAISAESPPTFSIASSPMQGSGPFRTTAMAKTPDGQTMVLVRAIVDLISGTPRLPTSSSPSSLHAELARDLTPPPPRGAQLTGTSPAPRWARASGPAFRSIQISPRGDRIYTIEPDAGVAKRPPRLGDRDHCRRRSRLVPARFDAVDASGRVNRVIALRPRREEFSPSRDRPAGHPARRAKLAGRRLAQPSPASRPRNLLPLALAFSPDGARAGRRLAAGHDLSLVG